MDEIEITLKWKAEKIHVKQLNEKVASFKKQNGFYAIHCNGELLYIGQTYAQTIEQRIKQEHVAYDCINEFKEKNNCDLFFILGVIVSKSVEYETKSLYDNIENCLIVRNKPFCNDDYPKFYGGD
ncbi:MAG: hypothetical protein HOP31_17465, partial [Ignavibacteria bacterium]|nr:hypothetical protein [Ignavibacteria bacterium]